MPIVGFRCPVPTKTLREVCSPEECLKSCRTGNGCHPPAYIANISQQVGLYNNFGTVSGSGLKPECDLKLYLERTKDFLVDPGDLHWASYRGALVHKAMEDFEGHPEAEGWVFEQRFFVALYFDGPDGAPRFEPMHMPNGRRWTDEERARFDAVVEDGGIILSGQVDSFDAPMKILWDYKTAKKVSHYVQDKIQYQWQVRFYAFLLRAHGYDVERVFLSFMDASLEDSVEVELGDLDTFMAQDVAPAAARLWAIRQGKVPAEPRPSYLCMPRKEGREYCNVKEFCPYWISVDGQPARVIWIDRPSTEELVEPSKCYGCAFYVTAKEKKDGVERKCPDKCPNMKANAPPEPLGEEAEA